MEHDLFVKELETLTPKGDYFKSLGLSDDFIRQLQARYNCLPKSKFLAQVYGGDEIIKLIENYDCAKIEIGPITFLYSPIEKHERIEVGKVDLDILCINKITLTIEVVDHDDTSYVIWQCASNGSTFLDVLLFCAQELTSRMTNNTNKQMANTKKIRYAAEMAGGDQYIQFYEMVLLE